MKKYHGRKETPERNFMERENRWTTEHTHRVETHKHNLCSLIPCQFESGNNHHCSSAIDWVKESLNYRRKLFMIWLNSSIRFLGRLKWDQEKKKAEKTDCIRDSCLSKQCGEQTVQQRKEMTWGKGTALGTHVQVWMFPGRAWDKETQGVRGLGWWGWVVAGVVKTCSDGALDVRNMSKSWKLCFSQDVWVTCRVIRFWHVTVIG